VEGRLSGAAPSLVWCAGVFASGSTWTYNMLRRAGAMLAPERPVVGRFVNAVADLDGIDDAAVLHIVKSHDLADEVAAELGRRAGRIVVTLRDPRDAVTSLMLYQRYGFAAALDVIAGSARFCARLAGDKRALVLRYESGFIDDPATLDRLAGVLGGVLRPDQRTALFALGRRATIEAEIAALPQQPATVRHPPSGDMFDPATQWHLHHAGRSGEVGRFRHMLRVWQIAEVEQRLGDTMAAFGYSAAVG
jgi:hypothetical protein